MKYFITLCFYLFSFLTSYTNGQVSILDFENIPGSNEFEGLKINNQYFNDFGVSFILENGNSPTLAKVGSPGTAFLSSAGDDSPIDESEVLLESIDEFEVNIMVQNSTCGLSDGVIDLQNNSDLVIKLNNKIIENPIITNLSAGVYNLVFDNLFGCVLEKEINILSHDCDLYIPNVFTPNNDGINDLFSIYTNPDFVGEFLEIAIYDRWGNQVFLSKDFNLEDMNWNGQYNGRNCSIGIYVYILTYKNSFDREVQINGSIQLLR